MKKNINIAIIGFGNIGGFFYNTLKNKKKKIELKTNKSLTIKYISAKKYH